MDYLGQTKKLQKIFWSALFLLLSIVLVSHRGLAQTGRGVIKGTVQDATKAVVPGAQVTVTNSSTNISQNAQTNEAGLYYFGAVQPGPYTVVVEVTGFKKWEGKIELQVGQTAVVDVGLELGSAETTVEVVGAAPPITTESAEVADVKDSQRIRQLPLNGRLISNLFNLTPGVEGGDSGDPNVLFPGANPRVNGLKVGAAEMLLDGVSLVDRFGGGMARVQPGLDTVQEFRIETVGSSAQYSRPATITLLTKSGTNAFHGSVFETHRNNAGGLRARQRQEGETSAKLIRNEFGASAGGPIYLGSLYDGRNKSFWFAAYEGLRQRQSRFAQDVVPTPAMWAGDFSGLVDVDGNQYQIYDPLTTDANGVRQPFLNNIIPSQRLNPFYKAMQELTALPTDATPPYQGPNFEKFYPANSDINTFTIKGDHRFSDKDSLSARFTRSRRQAKTLGGVYGNPAVGVEGPGSLRQDVKVYDPSSQHTHVFSPTFLNELLVAGHRSNNSSGTLGDLTDWAGTLGLPNPFGVTGWPTFYASEAGYTYVYFAFDGDNRNDQQLTSYIVEDNLTWVKGKHSMKFGGKYRQEGNNVRELQQAQGSHDFSYAWTALYDAPNDAPVPYTGSGLASMALGLPTTLRNQYNRGYYYFRQKEFGFYFHDNWKVSPRLTLDLGLRWDKWTPYTEKYDRLVQLDLDTFANTFQVITPKNVRMEDLPGIPPSVLSSWAARGLTWKTANELGYPSNLFEADNNNLGARIGAAFKITDKTVLRGGYGEYFWPMPLAQILQASRTNAPLNLGYSSRFSRFDDTDTYGLRNAPNPEFFIPDATVDIGAGGLVSPFAQSFRAFDGRNWRDGRAQSWHLSLERELMRDTSVRVSYIGDHGRDLEQVFAANSRVEYNYVLNTGQAPPGNRDLMRVNPDWNLGGSKNRTGYSNTHSAQVELERKYSNGLAFQWFYTFTRSRTTTDAGGFTNGGGGGINATDGQNTVPEPLQLLGQPNLSYDERLHLIYQNSSNIPAHRIRYNGIYDLPFGQGKRFGSGVSGGFNHLIGGWQVAFIGDWRSGFWRSVSSGRYLQGDPTLSPDERLIMNIFGADQRLWFRGDFDPTFATGVSQDALQALVPVDQAQRVLRPLGPNFDNRIPLQLADGSIRLTSLGETLNPNARAFYQGPGAWNDDIAVYKNFKITESVNVRFSADFFNAFNHPNDVDPNTTPGLQDLSIQRNDPRIIQFSLRFDW